MDMYRIVNDRMVDVWHVEDIAGMLQQLGVGAMDNQRVDSGFSGHHFRARFRELGRRSKRPHEQREQESHGQQRRQYLQRRVVDVNAIGAGRQRRLRAVGQLGDDHRSRDSRRAPRR